MTSVLDLLPGVPLVESPFFEEVLAVAGWDDETRRIATDLNRDGFAVFDFPEPDLDALADDIDRTLFAPLAWDDWRAGRVDELDRVGDAWTRNDSVRRIAANAYVAELLSRIYGRRAFPFQTLNFAIGSQQAAHVDLIHFASMPQNFMCGVWLALEDIAEGAGPLIYYPGSHRWPVYLNEHIGRPGPPANKIDERLEMYLPVWARQREASGVQPIRFHPKKGQALIWAAGLHHGGAPHTDRTKSRMSQVTHYMFEGCAYWTPLASAPFAGQIAFRRQMTDIRTGEAMENRVSGVPTPAAFMDLATPQADVALSAPPHPAAVSAPPPPPSLARRAVRRVRRLLGA